ncbi:MAG: phasin family protein [Rhodobiaceae bacterium]|nr:phasin family protein [Rhodobiaceae bacterium]MCC0054645.1 phasin family protein [Rhodobiaceae bacterium]
MPKSQSEMLKNLEMYNPFATAMPDSVRQMSGMQGRMLSACMKYNLEYLEFLKRRVEKDIALVQEMSAKDSPSDMMSACADFLRAAYADYSDEMSKFAGMSSSLLDEAKAETTRQIESVKTEVEVSAAA